MSTPSRNEPCPCGSGLKYKRCCLSKTITITPDANRSLHHEIQQATAGQEFQTMAEARRFIEQYMSSRNQTAQLDFAGLSSAQMHALLHAPFDSPEVVLFPEVLPSKPDAPVLKLFNLLAEAIGEEGVKTTAKGNLSQKLCRETALAYLGEEGVQEYTRYRGINKEEDFRELHIVRLVAGLAGLLRKYKGSFVLTRKFRDVQARHGDAGIYPLLMRAYAVDYNWGHGDRYPELGIVQQAFAFTLYLLQKYGKTQRPSEFYEKAFIRAFPMALIEAGGSYFPPERTLSSCYAHRSFRNFAAFFGLVELSASGIDLLLNPFSLVKTPLLDEVIRFQK